MHVIFGILLILHGVITLGGAALHTVHGGRLGELRLLARVPSGYTRHLTAVAHGDKRQVLVMDARARSTARDSRLP